LSVIGNIILTNDTFSGTDVKAQFDVVHELGHVWDYRSWNSLSGGLMNALGTGEYMPGVGFIWNPYGNAVPTYGGILEVSEPYPDTPYVCYNMYAITQSLALQTPSLTLIVIRCLMVQPMGEYLFLPQPERKIGRFHLDYILFQNMHLNEIGLGSKLVA
jgi:hypothetical protein